MDRHVIESIAIESGFDFELVSPGKEYEVVGYPDVVYLCEDKTFGDACIIWNNNFRQLIYAKVTKAAIRKMFEAIDATRECVVCFEELLYKGSWYCCCPQCNSVVCIACLMNILLPKEEEMKLLEKMPPTGSGILEYQCVECRTTHNLDMKFAYLTALDHFNELGRFQQDFVLDMKARDPISWQETKSDLSPHRMQFAGVAKSIKIGTKIILHSLRNKDDWNGEIAHIIGEKVMKNGVTRWPIQLMLPPQEKAALKPDNFFILDREREQRELKVGTNIRLHGLKRRKEWNGKAAEIIGKKITKQGVDRWPIQLVKSPNERALVKRINFNPSALVADCIIRLVPFYSGLQ